MKRVCLLVLFLFCAASAPAQPATIDLTVGGAPWLRTMATPYDPKQDEETYKVFTHILDFAGKEPITKGAGGKYTHHRGLYLGWKDTLVNGEDLDTWHMSNSTQELAKVLEEGDGVQRLEVLWKAKKGGGLIFTEERGMRARAGEGGARIIDFSSRLTSHAGTIPLKGDLHHAGMHVRLAQEVAEHEETTEYILPEGAELGANDTVTGAWWVICSAEVGGKRYWVMHMSPPSTPGGVPVYSVRKYARFGAFFETEVAEGTPLSLAFRVVVSEAPLDRAAGQALYDAYVKEMP